MSQKCTPAIAEHFDVVVVGAGVSGICAAHHIKRQFPTRKLVVFEGRKRVGGTWAMWRFPGVRSDTDMYSYSFPWSRWQKNNVFGSGDEILNYMDGVVRKEGLDRHIRFGCRVTKAAYDSTTMSWTLTAGGEVLTCTFLFMCSGYYEQLEAYTPDFPGVQNFAGALANPQFWPEDLGTKDKDIVVIGSGATAISIAPALAKTARSVTILQRSPTWVLSRPSQEPYLLRILRLLSPALASSINSWSRLSRDSFFYMFCKTFPDYARTSMLNDVAKHLQPSDMKHFTPSHNPWSERTCVLPNADLLTMIKSEQIAMVTDHIQEFTATGISLQSGRELKADVVVSATGFNLQKCYPMHDVKVTINGNPYDPMKTMIYKSHMLAGVPNFFFVGGYFHQSWTQRANLLCNYVCKLLKFMDAKGFKECCPKSNPDVEEFNFDDPQAPSSGYIQRSRDSQPKVAAGWPWTTFPDFFAEKVLFSRLHTNDGVIQFREGRSQHDVGLVSEAWSQALPLYQGLEGLYDRDADHDHAPISRGSSYVGGADLSRL